MLCIRGGFAAVAVTAKISHYDTKTGLDQDRRDFPPGQMCFGKAVQQQNRWPIAGIKRIDGGS